MAYITSCAIPDAATNMALKHIGQALSQVGIHAAGLLATSNERCSPLQDPDPFGVSRRAVMVNVKKPMVLNLEPTRGFEDKKDGVPNQF